LWGEALALRRRAIDMTPPSKNNGARSAQLRVLPVGEGGILNPTYGTAQMPVRGPVFGRMNESTAAERMLRIKNLSNDLEAI
jgi:hypothetical protein